MSRNPNNSEVEDSAIVCRFCHHTEDQTRAGLNRSGTRRYRCGRCQRHYTPEPKAPGYSEEIRRQAVEAFEAGVPLRRIARLLGVNHQSVVNWTRQPERVVPAASLPEPVTAPVTDIAPASLASKSRTTIEDVARQAGVAPSTISNFLNNKGRMSEETRERIRASIDALHFTPNALVRAIRARRTRILGVLIFDLNRIDNQIEYSPTIPLLAGIYDAADAAGHDVLLYTGWPTRPERHSGLDFLNGHVDGLLWAVPSIGAAALTRVAAADLPVVAMLSRHVPENVGFVNGDNESAIHALIGHLVERGHRRIAFAGPARSSSNYQDRRNGYREALKQFGLTYDAALNGATEDTRLIEGPCLQLMEGWRRLPVPPTAVVTVNDAWAESIGKAASVCGLRVPEDLAVTGFDDVLASQTILGGLTTVHQPFREIGQRAVERLVSLIDGAPVDSCRLTLPLAVVERTSTSSPCPGTS